MERGLSYDEEQHPRRPHLHHLMQDRLPKLGLDVDMYGPYVWGDEDDDDSDDDKDMDELKDLVVGVLQASSETHADEEHDDVWLQLIEDIGKANQLDAQRRRESKERHLQETKTKMEEDLAKAKLEEKVQVQVENNTKNNKSSQVDDATKRYLMQQYGYDEPAEDEDQGAARGGNSGSGNSGSGSGAGGNKSKSAAGIASVQTNRDVAAATHSEKNKEMKNANKTTKAEERKKTKDQKANKAQLKENRRKRAGKGERKA